MTKKSETKDATPAILAAAMAMDALGEKYDRSRLAMAASLIGGRTLHNCESAIDGMLASKMARRSRHGTIRLVTPADFRRHRLSVPLALADVVGTC